MVGIYSIDTDELLERCRWNSLNRALEDWRRLGYNVYLGPAFKNLILLH